MKVANGRNFIIYPVARFCHSYCTMIVVHSDSGPDSFSNHHPFCFHVNELKPVIWSLWYHRDLF